MKAKNYDEIEIGDKILVEIPGSGRMVFEVERINEDERSVMCKNNYLDFYPNEDDQYIVVD